MFKKLSIRMRLTLLSAFLLTVCCVGLTIVLNYSAFRLVHKIDATLITTPAAEIDPAQKTSEMNQELLPIAPSTQTQEAQKWFRIESVIYMLIVIVGGSALTYYVSGKALKPLHIFNDQVKNLNVENLSEALDVPPTNDEIAELT